MTCHNDIKANPYEMGWWVGLTQGYVVRGGKLWKSKRPKCEVREIQILTEFHIT